MSRDWRTAPLDAGDRALCEFAEKLSRTPWETTPADLDALRAAGFDDRAIHDATQVVAYFAYINRVADGLGVDPEPDMPPDPRFQPISAEAVILAAGESLAPLPSETGTMTIVWRCLRCNNHFPAGKPIPDACDHCGAPRTEFALVEED